MKIAVCTISTNRYWEQYKTLRMSLDRYFLKKYDVNKFVYTDREEKENFFRIFHLPPPLVTLMKFHYLIEKKDVLEKFDLLYFIDGDCECVSDIDDEIFPTKETPIVATKHPWQTYKSNSYENNPKSSAYVLDSGNNHYLQACFFGGFTKDVLNMSYDINELIKQDLKNCFFAKWHDESYMNKYLLNKPVKLLDCAYAYPTPRIWNQKFNCIPKIFHDNKNSTSL